MAITPGPWEWKRVQKPDWDNNGPDLRSAPLGKISDEYWGSNGSGPPGHKYGDAPPSGIVVSAWGHDAWGINVEDDDARLIAAAPELLAALQNYVAQYGMNATQMARDAIAKATGTDS